MPDARPPAIEKPATAGEVPATEEARNLAEEAIEALEDGDKEEAHFLAGEAKALDPAAAKEVIGNRKI